MYRTFQNQQDQAALERERSDRNAKFLAFQEEEEKQQGVTLSEPTESTLVNSYPEINKDNAPVIEENDTNTEPWTLYTFSYEETPDDYSYRKEWKSLSTEEIVTEKLGLDYALVLKNFKEANPADASWMNLWIKRCIIDKGWNENDPIPNIREIEVWEDPKTGEPVIEAFSFSDARKKAKEIGVADFESFFWQRKISGKKEHIMKGYQGPEIYYNQTHLSGKNYQQMVNELYKVSGDYETYQDALAEGKIGQGFVDLVKSAQEVIFFNKPDLDKYRDGLFGNDTRNAIDVYLLEIKGRDSYWEAMIRRFAREKSITLENARRITANFWNRPDVIEVQDQAMEMEAYLRTVNPGFDTNLKVGMANQSEPVRKEMEQKYSLNRVDYTNAKLEAKLQKEISLLTSTDHQIADRLIQRYPPRQSSQKKQSTGTNPKLPKSSFYNSYNPNLIPLYQPYLINPALSSYNASSNFMWNNTPLKFNSEKHPYVPKVDFNKSTSDQLIQRFKYWKKWQQEEAEMQQIKGQSQTLKEQSIEIKDLDDQFINYVCAELGYSKSGKPNDPLNKGSVYLSPLEQKEQKTFYQAWLELKIQLIMLTEAEKKSGKLSPKIITAYNQFERLLFAHGDQIFDKNSSNGEDFKEMPFSPEMLIKNPGNFEDIQRRITFYRQMIRFMLREEIQNLKDSETKRNLTDYLQQNSASRKLFSLVQKAKQNADSSGHTFTKIAATFITYWNNRENEQSFSGPYNRVETKGQDIQMYVEKNGHVIVHLFLGASEEDHFQFTGISISEALKDMNSVKGVLSPGVIRYKTEKGWYQEFIVDPPSWTWSEALGVASLVLAIIAIPVTGGASAALVVASTTTGIASSGFAMHEESLKGQLSTGEVWQHSGFMVANLLPMVRGISTLAKLKNASGLLGKIGTVTEGYSYLKVSVGIGIGATTIDGIVIADSYYSKFKEIEEMTDLSREERDTKRAQLLREGLITGMITLTGFLDLASLKSPNSKGSKHWADSDIPVSGKNKSIRTTSQIADANTTHPLTDGIQQTGNTRLSGSTQPNTASGNKKTTQVVVAKDAEGNFHKQNPETGEFERITREEFEQIETATKKNGGEVVTSEKSGKLEESSLKVSQAENIIKLSSKSSLDSTLFNQLDNVLDSAPSIMFNYGSKAPQTPKQFLNEVGNDMYDIIYNNESYVKFDNTTGRMLYSDGTNQYFIHFETDINVSNVEELINTRITQFRNYLGLNGPQNIELKHGLGNVIPSTNKTTTFIGKTDETILLKKQFGNFKHYKVGESPGSVNLLNMPDTYWNPATWFKDYNRDWMVRAIKRGDDIYIASLINERTLINETDLGTRYGSYFANELNELVKARMKPKNISQSDWDQLIPDIKSAAAMQLPEN